MRCFQDAKSSSSFVGDGLFCPMDGCKNPTRQPSVALDFVCVMILNVCDATKESCVSRYQIILCGWSSARTLCEKGHDGKRRLFVATCRPVTGETHATTSWPPTKRRVWDPMTRRAIHSWTTRLKNHCPIVTGRHDTD